MAYKKPQIVAKSAAKQIFVAGCPTQLHSLTCNPSRSCQVWLTRNPKSWRSPPPSSRSWQVARLIAGTVVVLTREIALAKLTPRVKYST